MILKKLFLHNFRNFDNEKFIFEKRNIIYGKNAQGKTSILEAIFLLSLGRSFRTSKLTELIKHKKKFFFIEAEIIKDLVTQKISIYFDRNNKKKIKHNHTSIYSFSHLFGIMPTILHSPYDINIISGYPTKRRRFLNIHLAQKDPLYVYHLTRFYRALKQRNTLLQKKLLTNIEIWEDEIAKSASYITYARNKLLLLLKNPIQNSIDSLSEKTEKIFSKKSIMNTLSKRYNSMKLGNPFSLVDENKMCLVNAKGKGNLTFMFDEAFESMVFAGAMLILLCALLPPLIPILAPPALLLIFGALIGHFLAHLRPFRILNPTLNMSLKTGNCSINGINGSQQYTAPIDASFYWISGITVNFYTKDPDIVLLIFALRSKVL